MIENKLTCARCNNREFDLVQGFLSHMSRSHQINSEQIYREIYNITSNPLCKCGCNKEVKYHTFTTGYWGHILGHASDGSNFTDEGRKKSHEVYKQNLASGKTVRERKEKIIDSSKEFKCPKCEWSYDNSLSLCIHWSSAHNLQTDLLWLIKNNLFNPPTCKCGCEKEVTFLDFNNGYREYTWGHAARINNNYQTPKSIANSRKTINKMINSGEYKPFHLIETGEYWSKGLTKETDERIARQSESIKGEKSPNWKGGISGLGNLCRMDRKLYNGWKFPILKKSNFKCEKCGNSQNLQVHHNKEKMIDIIRKIAEDNGWIYEVYQKLYENNEHMELKEKISNAVSEYHIKNNVSGEVLCYNCHKEEHR